MDIKGMALLIKLALVVGMTVGLPKATLWMMTEAFKAQKSGFVSYRAINAALQGNGNSLLHKTKKRN